MKPTKIVLITSGQPATNPRLVKEADALTEAGYEVVVLYQYYSHWATELDKVLLKTKRWKAIKVGGDPNQDKIAYFKSKIAHKISKALSAQLGFRWGLPLSAIGRATPSLIAEAKNIKADLYIAHNLAALPAAVIAAKKHHAKCGFDAEDFHRNEVADGQDRFDVKLKTEIENRFLNKLDYLTTSSDQIGLAYQSIYPKLNPITILNVFPTTQYTPNKIGNGLKLFWFSQTVGAGRGLEDVIKALAQLKDLDIELHLLGNADEQSQSSIKVTGEKLGLHDRKIIFHSPIPPDDIVRFASAFDIGLATEIGIPRNRDLCLTNKLFTYLNAGLAVIATDTSAQKAFMEKYPQIGSVYPIGNLEALINIISNYYHDRTRLEEAQFNSLSLANQTLNWENEKSKFLLIVKNVL
ncbi:glycosyltransferase [Pedobacter yonginense]|uniref:glycosyltransferase n=1 Tax=Pedobacter yonginense TaxID=651869 RepID=UPI0014020AF7|nr:glycosyltransferase [Pedobacter yonginense]